MSCLHTSLPLVPQFHLSSWILAVCCDLLWSTAFKGTVSQIQLQETLGSSALSWNPALPQEHVLKNEGPSHMETGLNGTTSDHPNQSEPHQDQKWHSGFSAWVGNYNPQARCLALKIKFHQNTSIPTNIFSKAAFRYNDRANPLWWRPSQTWNHLLPGSGPLKKKKIGWPLRLQWHGMEQ